MLYTTPLGSSICHWRQTADVALGFRKITNRYLTAAVIAQLSFYLADKSRWIKCMLLTELGYR